MYLDLVCDTTRKLLKEIIIEYKDLSNKMEELMNLSHAKIKNLRKIFGCPSEIYVKMTLKNMIRFYSNENYRVTGVIYS